MLYDPLVNAVQDSTRRVWSDSAIRDTVAKIASGSAYHRGLTESLWNRITRWLFDRLNDLFSAVSHVPYGKFIGIALLLGAIGLIGARIILGLSDERTRTGSSRRPRLGATGDIAIEDADRLAAAGDYTGAVHALFAALLSASAARGEIRLHPSKTSGDYARELRRKNAPWLRSFQSFRSLYDRVIYGDLSCTANEYAVLAREVRTVLQGARAA